MLLILFCMHSQLCSIGGRYLRLNLPRPYLRELYLKHMTSKLNTGLPRIMRMS